MTPSEMADLLVTQVREAREARKARDSAILVARAAIRAAVEARRRLDIAEADLAITIRDRNCWRARCLRDQGQVA